MAASNNTRETVRGVVLTDFPTVQIPLDFQIHEGRIEFQLETAEGSVRVGAYTHNFYCKGTAAALVACGLLQPDWFPGLPGNNSIRQSVAFNEGFPRLLKGRRRGARNPALSIIITRLSRQVYEVIVPTTDEQKKVIDEIAEDHKRKAHEEKAAAENAALRVALRAQSPGKVRQKCLNMIDMVMSLNDANLEEAGYRYNKDSQARINRAFSELRNAYAEGGIVQVKHGSRRDGNVIYLGAQPAAEVAP